MVTLLNILRDFDRTPAWLCRKAGVSPTLFTLMKKGERSITEPTKDKFAKVLGIRKEILFNGEGFINKESK